VKYILLEFSFKPTRRKILCVKDLGFPQVIRDLSKRYSVRETVKPPSKRTLRRWRASGIMRAICGCTVRPGERCETHNAMSWDAALIGCSEYTYG
jgi:hypothetical protein